MISLPLSGRAEKLRSECTAWLRSNPPPRLSGRIELERFVEISREWQRRLAAERWVGVHWPERFGGRSLSLVEEAVLQECLASAGSPQLINLFGLTMVGPVLIQHGTEEQRLRYLPRILSAEEIWCQGFSEPEAGSDLAAVRTRAERVAGGASWSVTGQKVWTSFAQTAAWCFLLVKTEPDADRYKSLSYILVPMSSAGITVRPLMQISGDREFNEIFFDQVVVPIENTVGQAGEGWKIAISTLMYERVVLTFARHLQSEHLLQEIRSVLRAARKTDRRDQPESKRVLGVLLARSMAVRALALSHLLSYEGAQGERVSGQRSQPGPEGSLDKLGWSETFQEICQLGLSVLGPEGIGNSSAAEFFQHQYLYSRGRTIAAGTSEIQRNIIAERVLGLPRHST